MPDPAIKSYSSGSQEMQLIKSILVLRLMEHQFHISMTRHGVNSIWSIPIPHQIDQFQFNSNSIFYLLLFTFYEYLLGIPTQNSLYSK